jgi:hypothetical protein
MTFIVQSPKYNKCFIREKHQVEFCEATDDDPLHLDHSELPQVYLLHYELYEWPLTRKLFGNFMQYTDAIFKVTTLCDQDNIIKGKDLFVRWNDMEMSSGLTRISRLFISNEEWEKFQKRYGTSLQSDAE